jgi:hypothetical protein
MKTHIVFVKFKQPGISGVRYIDSQWAEFGHAVRRKTELSDSLEMFDVPDWSVEILTGEVADVVIQPAREIAEALAKQESLTK